MTRLSDATAEQLEAELARRKNMPQAPPSLSVAPDGAPLWKMIGEYVAWCASGDYHEDNDWSHYIYECALTCAFGGDAYFKWINARTRSR